jgi:hypothetical protein
MNNQGYNQDWDSSTYKLARQYLAERSAWPDWKFNHEKDCVYLGNFCHMDYRGRQRFFRPSACVKFVLANAAWVFETPDYLTSYHGTESGNINSILSYGLLPAGETAGSTVIPKKNGEALRAIGRGVYTSRSPLYAQLYSPIEWWRGHPVQTVLMTRQPERDIHPYSDEGCASVSLIKRNDIWRLYGGSLRADELQMMTTNYRDIVIQAIIVKIHDQDPTTAGGEYDRIRRCLSEIC